MNTEELIHLVKQFSGQQSNSYKPTLYGHIANYDSKLHRVRLLFPSLSDGNGGYVLSAWIPLGSIASGAGYGVQYIPYGGSTQENPTAGEQCTVQLLDHNRGVAATPTMFYNEAAPPPSAAGNFSPGDLILATKGGASLVLKGNGSAINIIGPSGSIINVTAPEVNIGANGETLHALVTAIAWTYLTTHVHTNGNGGGDTGPPVNVPTSEVLTTTLQAG